MSSVADGASIRADAGSVGHDKAHPSLSKNHENNCHTSSVYHLHVT